MTCIAWSEAFKDRIQSALGCIQFLSDKSHISFGAGSLVFYPLFVTTLNLSKNWNQCLTSFGCTVAANLPIKLHDAEEGTAVNGNLDSRRRLRSSLSLKTGGSRRPSREHSVQYQKYLLNCLPDLRSRASDDKI